MLNTIYNFYIIHKGGHFMISIILSCAKLARHKKKNEQQFTATMGVGQKIYLQESVIYNWRIKEEMEGICTLTFDFKPAEKWHNMHGNFSGYQVQRNADGKAMLVRIAE